jgi:signal transduction histidine kinase
VDLESDWLKNVCIKADRFKLNQVLRNFLSNALKFCNRERGEVRVTVERRPLSASRVVRSIGPRLDDYTTDDVVRVNVRDNGIGISTENQKKLFGQYVQFNAGQAQKGGGSGLGLPTARKIIEAHGGTIDIESTPGRGTKVTIWLPAPPRLPTVGPPTR